MIFNSIPVLPIWAENIVLPLNRWVHIVCTTTLVGGTLFYEFVLPRAIEDLKEETQAAVMGRVRWIFRQIVIVSAALLVLSGLVSSYRIWPMYHNQYDAAQAWWAVHVIVGTVALSIPVALTIGDRVPRHPIVWLRLNFMILLLVIFTASVARYIRLSILDEAERNQIRLSGTDNPVGP